MKVTSLQFSAGKARYSPYGGSSGKPSLEPEKSLVSDIKRLAEMYKDQRIEQTKGSSRTSAVKVDPRTIMVSIIT